MNILFGLKIIEVNKIVLVLGLFVAFFTNSFSQDFFRLKTDFTIKSKTLDGKQQLTVGKIYYDKNIKKLVFQIRFPEKETWVQKDTSLYKIVEGKVVSRQTTPDIAGLTIYHLALNGDLADYGLKKSNMKIIDVEKDGNKIISTWSPPPELEKTFGSILMLNVNQQLVGIIFKNPEGEVVSRQFFRNYLTIDGLSFPQELVKETTVDGVKYYEVTTYKNMIINEKDNSDKYDYKIP